MNSPSKQSSSYEKAANAASLATPICKHSFYSSLGKAQIPLDLSRLDATRPTCCMECMFLEGNTDIIYIL